MGVGIDLQQVLAQTNAAERVQQVQQQHPDMQQRYFELQQGVERKQRNEQVELTEDAEKALIRERQKRSKERREADTQSKGEEQDQAGSEKDGSEAGHGTLVDIKV
ncbi:MAG: hypothetical protein JW950_04215 [Deltaproteobacteria bacterium]|nr:hypothetical protein [Deltaproteobacteria bacterium]